MNTLCRADNESNETQRSISRWVRGIKESPMEETHLEESLGG